MEQGWDPEIKKYFRKILNSVFAGLLWMSACVTAGIYYKLAYWERPFIYPVIFYAGMIASLVLLIFWYYRTWKK
jgi:FtsH-binding integral membrane protein